MQIQDRFTCLHAAAQAAGSEWWEGFGRSYGCTVCIFPIKAMKIIGELRIKSFGFPHDGTWNSACVLADLDHRFCSMGPHFGQIMFSERLSCVVCPLRFSMTGFHRLKRIHFAHPEEPCCWTLGVGPTKTTQLVNFEDDHGWSNDFSSSKVPYLVCKHGNHNGLLRNP